MFENILGNEKNKNILEKSIELNKTSHSYIFWGTEGIGKKIIAKEFAKKILCIQNHDYNCKCKSCIEFDSNNNPIYGNTTVAVKINGVTVKNTKIVNGNLLVNITVPSIKAGKNVLTIILGENNRYNSVSVNSTLTVLKQDPVIKIEKITDKLKFPMFVKPSNSGSSVGVKKATNNEELKMAIENAGQYDNKILIEQGINAREVECAILDGTEVRASTVGEIISAEEFYSFDAKYNIPESKTIIPADISKEQIEQIQKLAIRAFKAIDGSGLARVDFFIEKDTNKIYINEINTMPGFTKISMYPKLFEAVGIKYSELLDKLIANAIKD